MNLIDLAGSERAGRMRLSGKLLEEAKAINRNLNALGNVVSSLSGEGVSQKGFVPWRDSKLTRILSEPMANGKCHTVLVVNISPDLSPDYDDFEPEDAHETQTALEFGERAMCAKISTNKELNIDDLKQVVENLQNQLDTNRDDIRAMRISHANEVRSIQEDIVDERNRVATLLDFIHSKGFDLNESDIDDLHLLSSRIEESNTKDIIPETITREPTEEDVLELPRQSPETIRLVESFQQNAFAVSSAEDSLKLLVSMVRARDSWLLSLAAHVTQLHRLLCPDDTKVPPRLYGMFLDNAGVWSGERWSNFFREAGLPALGRDHEFILREISACTAPAEEWARQLKSVVTTLGVDVRQSNNDKLRKIAPELEALVRKCAEVSKTNE